MKLSDRKLCGFSGIYKITNTRSGHSYIGQAKNISRRIWQHINSSLNKKKSDYDYPLHQAIRKYGIDAFELDVLEKCCGDAMNDREIHYIEKYHTCKLDAEWSGGYNLTFGGRQSIRQIKLTTQNVAEIRWALAETAVSMTALALKYGVCKDLIYDINAGAAWYDSSVMYPIRPKHNRFVAEYRFDGTCVVKLDKKTRKALASYPSRNAAAIELGCKSYAPHIGEAINGKRASAYGFAWERREISEEAWLSLLSRFYGGSGRL